MEAPRPSYRELTDPKNRNVLSTINPKTWACWQRSWARAVELEIVEKQNMLLESLMQTAGFDGRGREDLRDALMGVKPAPQAFGSIAPPTDGRPHL
jgi:hypothetical protein